MYLVYIIKSSMCDLYYIGMTNNFLRRWMQHNSILKGGAKFTKRKKDWYPICIIDGFQNKVEAMQCEWKFKTRRGKFARSFKGIKGRLNYLNYILKNNKCWTSNSPCIKAQNLKIYIDDQYKDYIDAITTDELYWKY